MFRDFDDFCEEDPFTNNIICKRCDRRKKIKPLESYELIDKTISGSGELTWDVIDCD